MSQLNFRSYHIMCLYIIDPLCSVWSIFAFTIYTSRDYFDLIYIFSWFGLCPSVVSFVLCLKLYMEIVNYRIVDYVI